MSTVIQITPSAFSVETAALASGVSEDIIRRAIRAGDLQISNPKVNGKPITKNLIPRADLEAWIEAGKSPA